MFRYIYQDEYYIDKFANLITDIYTCGYKTDMPYFYIDILLKHLKIATVNKFNKNNCYLVLNNIFHFLKDFCLKLENRDKLLFLPIIDSNLINKLLLLKDFPNINEEL